jgi:hypothetical protein
MEERKMGIRGEIYSTTVGLPNRTYFFNVKENRLGDLYLNIVESKNKDSGGFERQSVILFAEDLTEFLRGFDESLRALEKAMKEKRRGAARPRDSSGEGRPRGAAAEGGAGKKRYAAGSKPGPGSAADRGGRKVVVRKRKDT